MVSLHSTIYKVDVCEQLGSTRKQLKLVVQFHPFFSQHKNMIGFTKKVCLQAVQFVEYQDNPMRM